MSDVTNWWLLPLGIVIGAVLVTAAVYVMWQWMWEDER
jgi:hypothetical protein